MTEQTVVVGTNYICIHDKEGDTFHSLVDIERKKEFLRRESSTIGIAGNLELDGSLDLDILRQARLGWIVSCCVATSVLGLNLTAADGCLGIVVENGKLAASLGACPNANVDFFAIQNFDLVCAA